MTPSPHTPADGGSLPTTEEIQRMQIDALKIFCPSAIPYVKQAQRGEDDSAFMWREAFQHVFNALIYSDKALQSLTPGGSEYVNNPDRCVALVKEQQAALHEARKDAMRLKKTTPTPQGGEEK